jgi:hypothetical protein
LLEDLLVNDYQLGKDIQDIKLKLEAIEALLKSTNSSSREFFNLRLPPNFGNIPGLSYYSKGNELIDSLTQEALVADRQGRTNDADRIRKVRSIVERAPDNINSGEASDISSDVARGDYDSAERTAGEAARDRNPN